MSNQSRRSDRRPRATRRVLKQRRLVIQAPESDPNATLDVPGLFSSNERYFFLVNAIGAECPEAVFNFLLEMCWARKRFETGHLYFEDCFTADGNRNYFAKLAGELRKSLGHRGLLGTGSGCYWLLFNAGNITLSPRLLEMKSLDSRVLDKLRSVINSSTH